MSMLIQPQTDSWLKKILTVAKRRCCQQPTSAHTIKLFKKELQSGHARLQNTVHNALLQQYDTFHDGSDISDGGCVQMGQAILCSCVCKLAFMSDHKANQAKPNKLLTSQNYCLCYGLNISNPFTWQEVTWHSINVAVNNSCSEKIHKQCRVLLRVQLVS